MPVRLCRIGVLALSALLLTISGAAAIHASEILVGATVSREGRFQAPSRMMHLAYRLWEQEINKAGGILGRPVRLIFYDDKSRKDLVQQYYEKMIVEDNVDLVLAPYGTTLTYAASSVTERHGYVLLASGASGEIIWSRGYRYVFGVYGVAGRYFIGFLDIAARAGLKSLAILSEDALFTMDAANGAANWARRLGLDIQWRHTYQGSTKDFKTAVAKLQELAPDAVVVCTYPPDGYAFLQELAQTTYRPRALAMSITPSLPDFFENAGPQAEGVFGPSQWEPDERIPFPGTRRFVAEFEKFTNLSPSYHAGSAYAGCQLLQESIAASGSLDHGKIRDYIASLDTVTVIGRFKVDPRGRQIGHNTIIIQWQDGKKEIVYPGKMQTSKPKFKPLAR